MSKVKLNRLHALAWEEIEAADEWYLARSSDASQEFVEDVDAAVEEILQTPKRWPKFLYGTRRFVMRRFPFSIVYLADPDRITIIAVAHSKRKPGY